MSLKGTSAILKQEAVYADLKKRWEQERKRGAIPEVPDGFPRFLCGEIMRERERAKEEAAVARRRERERNISLGLCAVLLAASLFLALRPVPAVENEELSTDTAVQQEAVVTKRNYVASVNSDKYHYPSCDYAQNILEENRVYYETASQAESAGKQPCSVCRP